MRKMLIFILLLAFLACQKKENAATLPVYNQANFTPLWLSKKEMETDTIHRIADFSFQNQLGETVTNAQLDGKIYVANFIFTICPSICPKMQDNLDLVQKTFATDPSVLLVSHTVMPWVDSVAQLKSYGQKRNIDPKKWQLLTGDAGKIYDLARKSYFAEEEIGYAKDSTEFLHTEHVLLIDGKRRLRGVYNGTLPLEIERLIEDIKVLKRE
ncbi:MAG: SCO family protein [Saprospiraceae bacterium]|nr:SCO family protein [Saprospiraceae bacterium]